MQDRRRHVIPIADTGFFGMGWNHAMAGIVKQQSCQQVVGLVAYNSAMGTLGAVSANRTFSQTTLKSAFLRAFRASHFWDFGLCGFSDGLAAIFGASSLHPKSPFPAASPEPRSPTCLRSTSHSMEKTAPSNPGIEQRESTRLHSTCAPRSGSPSSGGSRTARYHRFHRAAGPATGVSILIDGARGLVPRFHLFF